MGSQTNWRILIFSVEVMVDRKRFGLEKKKQQLIFAPNIRAIFREMQ